jgi:hypothetical protein
LIQTASKLVDQVLFLLAELDEESFHRQLANVICS